MLTIQTGCGRSARLPRRPNPPAAPLPAACRQIPPKFCAAQHTRRSRQGSRRAIRHWEPNPDGCRESAPSLTRPSASPNCFPLRRSDAPPANRAAWSETIRAPSATLGSTPAAAPHSHRLVSARSSFSSPIAAFASTGMAHLARCPVGRAAKHPPAPRLPQQTLHRAPAPCHAP